jgi:hypothetical protein
VAGAGSRIEFGGRARVVCAIVILSEAKDLLSRS